jgi:hypothetical protein
VSIHIKKRHRGIRFARTKREPLERAFAVAWQEVQETSPLLLEHILSNTNTPHVISDNDRLVANTIIQWLGTNVGQCFLSGVGAKVRRKAS